MQINNILFGEPPEKTPLSNHRNLPLLNNRKQYPDIILNIDELNIDNLPVHIRYYGLFNNSPNAKNRVIVFRYYDHLLFHNRDYDSDSQSIFPWEAIYWLVECTRNLNPSLSINLSQTTQKINEHQLALLKIMGDKAEQAGYLLRDYDGINRTAVFFGCIEKKDIFVEQYFSNYGLLEQNGLKILQKAAADMTIFKE